MRARVRAGQKAQALSSPLFWLQAMSAVDVNVISVHTCAGA